MNPLAEQAAYFIPIVSSEQRTAQDTEDHRIELALGQIGIRTLPRHPAMSIGHVAWGDYQQQSAVYMEVLEADLSRARWAIMNLGPDEQATPEKLRVARELAAIQYVNWQRRRHHEPNMPILVLVNRSRSYDAAQQQLARMLKEYGDIVEYDQPEDISPRVRAWLIEHR